MIASLCDSKQARRIAREMERTRYQAMHQAGQTDVSLKSSRGSKGSPESGQISSSCRLVDGTVNLLDPNLLKAGRSIAVFRIYFSWLFLLKIAS